LIAAQTRAQSDERPWEWPWWRTTSEDAFTLGWIVLIHLTAAIGLVLFPLPGWRLLGAAFALAWIGGIGTTVCYHRAVAHRALSLKPWAFAILTFFAVLNGSGKPITWVSGHRLHHATADTDDDISSPRHGFLWSHLRWLWQAGIPEIDRFCVDLNRPMYKVWNFLQPPILALSYFGGLWFGWPAFFWLGSIRLVFALHAQCFVNSICHTEPTAALGEDSSRNVSWLAAMHLFQGENWHRNHHARPGSAQLGWTWRQPDLGYLTICALEKIGAATDVRRLRRV
jgi:stearoyl-CoA desaturase (delta-9 desaturase)